MQKAILFIFGITISLESIAGLAKILQTNIQILNCSVWQLHNSEALLVLHILMVAKTRFPGMQESALTKR